MELRILGTVELWANGQSHPLGSLKERHLLACLAYDAGHQIPADTLVERMWEGAAPPSDAGKRLQPVVSRLRRRLRAAGGTASPNIESSSGTYCLEADPQMIDARRFATLAAQARTLADSGDDERALQFIHEAEPLWRGEPLAGLPGLWAEQVRRSLASRHLAIALIRAGIALRHGQFADIVGDLSALTAQHPTDESLGKHLMVALYGSGRSADALEVYRTMRRRMRNDLGSEPSPDIRLLERAILQHTPIAQLVPSSAPVTPPRHLTGPPPNNLPRRTTMIGRSAEMSLIRAAVARVGKDSGGVIALESIAGMAGVGKSTLAIHAAYELRDRFPDGQIHLDLRTHSSEQEPLTTRKALDTLIRIADGPHASIPADFDTATALWRKRLANRRIILVLDDIAHPEQIEPLLPGEDSPSLVITTSRRRLASLPDQKLISLDILTESNAVELFRKRVGAERTENLAEVTEIVRLCGNLPLAIEISASRLNSRAAWSTADLAQRLATTDDRLSEIRDSSRGISRSFELSYRDLDVTHQRAFRQLGLHIGKEFESNATAALFGIDLGATEEILEELFNLHLIEELAPQRYTMHDLLREYANNLSRLEEEDQQRSECVNRLIDYYVSVTDEADRILYPHRPRIEAPIPRRPCPSPFRKNDSEIRRWFTREYSTIIACLERAWKMGPSLRAAVFTNALGGFHDEERHGPAVLSLHQQAVRFWQSLKDQRAEARALIDLNLTFSHSGRYEEAISTAERAVSMSREAKDTEAMAEGLHQLAVAYGLAGRLQDSLSLQREALAIRLNAADRQQQARSLNNYGISLSRLGEYRDALAIFQSALDGFSISGDKRSEMLVQNNLGEVYRQTNRFELARDSYQKALMLSMQHGSLADRSTIQMNLAGSLLEIGEAEQALVLYREALTASRHIGEKRNESIALNGIGKALLKVGDYLSSSAHHDQALAIAQHIGAATEEAESLLHRGLAKWKCRELDDAVHDVQSALLLAESLHEESIIRRAQRALTDIRRGIAPTLLPSEEG